ncbi:MAG: hypothetical protein Q9222_005062 [Ikaeria aurantiellina]
MANRRGPTQPRQAYEKDEKVLCFHGELLYEAKILEVKQDSPSEPFSYRIHYKGWKGTWDDWVEDDRLRKYNDENRETEKALKRQYLESTQKAAKPTATKRKGLPSDFGSARGSEERASASATGRGQKRGRNAEIDEEESFHARPMIKIPIPDYIKSLLVDDWEEVTKNLRLVPLPAAKPVNMIIDEYFEEEKEKRFPGSAEFDLLEEVRSGLKEYFDVALGRMLLYRFERQQYLEARRKWTEGKGEWKGRICVGDVYGAEHLCRMIVSLPEMIAQTNMDGQSVNRLREEMTKFLQWLGRNTRAYFTADYEPADKDYTEKTRAN